MNPSLAAQGTGLDCREPQTCSQLALEARSRGAYETFHDLAWRAIQTGRANDPDLMYLLARAQALSGRRRDALVTLRRLGDAGVVTDAATEEDFSRVRELPGWRDVEALGNRATRSGVITTPPPPSITLAAPAVAPPAPAAATPVPAAAPPAAPKALRIEPAAVDEVARFSAAPFDPAGLAYDAVSRRFLFGDAAGRRLFVVGEGADRTVDLVRAESAGFEDVTALALDSRRGELWVASSAASGDAAAIHRLQLISGRVVGRFPVDTESGAVRLADLALSANGLVVALDRRAARVLVLRPGATAIDRTISLDVADPISVAVDDEGRAAYVAHGGGILRLDLQARTAAPLAAATGIDLTNVERLRWHRDALVVVQGQADGSRGFVRLELNRAGRTVTGAALLEVLRDDSLTFIMVSGDDLYYLVVPPPASGTMTVVVRRVRLR